MFNYLEYKNKIPIKKFLLEKVESISPLSTKFKPYWKNTKRECIEGRWVAHEGEYKWVPGSLHFYVNFWHILLSKKGGKSKTKSVGKPLLRDLEWIKHYVYVTARGFSGFSEDTEFASHRALIGNPEEVFSNLEELDEDVRLSLYYKGQQKTYVPALEYLYRYFSKPLGKPLFYNQALNVADIESRGLGKSYTMSALCAHNFLFDGAMDYDEYLEAIKNKQPLASETLVGAIDSKYSNDLIKKIKLGLDYLEGGTMVGGIKYPSPLSKKYTGSFESGKTLIQESDIKIGGKWEKVGSKSKLQHRTFGDNPYAANGTRPGFMVIDEVGFMGNLELAMGQIAECTADGAAKFGTVWLTGTGGAMISGATQAIRNIFLDPKANSCLEFDDIFENTGKKIGFFVPAWMGLNQFKDELGNTLKERAIKYLETEREIKRRGKSKAPYDDELQQRPFVPSEAFLLSTGNKFPIADLMNQLKVIETSSDPSIKGTKGELIIDEGGKVRFVPDLSNRLVQCEYPSKDMNPGCVVIYEHPINNPPYGFYISGNDSCSQAATNSSDSVGATYIMRRASVYENSDRVVAEYVGRPLSLKEHNEVIRRLLIYYNAICLYENNVNNVKEYFETKNSLHLLAKSPTILKATVAGHLATQYGIRMSKQIKEELEFYFHNWLLEEVPGAEGKLNIHFLYSAPLIKELIAYNDEDNFDRTVAFMCMICQKLQMHKVLTKKIEERKIDPFFSRKYYC
jgi:hypothetical protein